MQLLRFQRDTGLDAVCWTYSEFTFYKQTPSTFTFSLSPLDVTLDVTPDNTHKHRQRLRAASSLGCWATELWAPQQWGAGLVLGPVGRRGIGRTHMCTGCSCLCDPSGSALSLAASLRCRWGVGGQPSPGHSTGRGTCQEKTQPPGWKKQCWTPCTEQREGY